MTAAVSGLPPGDGRSATSVPCVNSHHYIAWLGIMAEDKSGCLSIQTNGCPRHYPDSEDPKMKE